MPHGHFIIMECMISIHLLEIFLYNYLVHNIRDQNLATCRPRSSTWCPKLDSSLDLANLILHADLLPKRYYCRVLDVACIRWKWSIGYTEEICVNTWVISQHGIIFPLITTGNTFGKHRQICVDDFCWLLTYCFMVFVKNPPGHCTCAGERARTPPLSILNLLGGLNVLDETRLGLARTWVDVLAWVPANKLDIDITSGRIVVRGLISALSHWDSQTMSGCPVGTVM